MGPSGRVGAHAALTFGAAETDVLADRIRRCELDEVGTEATGDEHVRAESVLRGRQGGAAGLRPLAAVRHHLRGHLLTSLAVRVVGRRRRRQPVNYALAVNQKPPRPRVPVSLPQIYERGVCRDSTQHLNIFQEGVERTNKQKQANLGQSIESCKKTLNKLSTLVLLRKETNIIFVIEF